jgi:hypothetical protein
VRKLFNDAEGYVFMSKRFFSVCLLFTMGTFLALVLGPGCKTYDSASKTVKSATQKVQSVYKDVVPWDSAGGDKLKKRVVVAPFLDQANLGEERVARVRAEFISMLKEDKELLVHDIQELAPTRAKIRSPKYGIVTDPDLAKRAEAMGMNVLVTVVLNPIEIEYRRVGFYPFRWLKKELELSMVVNATDLINGTLFLTSLESKKIKVPKELQEDKDLEEILAHKDFTEAANKILARQASALKKGLDDHPWSGKVLSVSGEKVMISAGEDVNVAVGDIFEVFERGKPIRAAGGTHIFLLGTKVGEVRVDQIMKKYSVAAPLSNVKIQAGQVIRLKRN